METLALDVHHMLVVEIGANPASVSASPVAMRPTRMAAPIASAGRRSPLGPLGIISLVSIQLCQSFWPNFTTTTDSFHVPVP